MTPLPTRGFRRVIAECWVIPRCTNFVLKKKIRLFLHGMLLTPPRQPLKDALHTYKYEPTLRLIQK